jgi:hypothetical protein
VLSKNLNTIIMVGLALTALLTTKHFFDMSIEKRIFTRLVANGVTPALALLIVAQSKHETSMLGVPYTSHQFISNNNAFGYGYVQGNRFQVGAGGKHPEDGGVYAKYASLENCVDDISGWYNRRKSQFAMVTTPLALATSLKLSSYYTGTLAGYTAGLTHFYKTTLA